MWSLSDHNPLRPQVYTPLLATLLPRHSLHCVKTLEIPFGSSSLLPSWPLPAVETLILIIGFNKPWRKPQSLITNVYPIIHSTNPTTLVLRPTDFEYGVSAPKLYTQQWTRLKTVIFDAWLYDWDETPWPDPRAELGGEPMEYDIWEPFARPFGCQVAPAAPPYRVQWTCDKKLDFAMLEQRGIDVAGDLLVGSEEEVEVLKRRAREEGVDLEGLELEVKVKPSFISEPPPSRLPLRSYAHLPPSLSPPLHLRPGASLRSVTSLRLALHCHPVTGWTARARSVYHFLSLSALSQRAHTMKQRARGHMSSLGQRARGRGRLIQ